MKLLYLIIILLLVSHISSCNWETGEPVDATHPSQVAQMVQPSSEAQIHPEDESIHEAMNDLGIDPILQNDPNEIREHLPRLEDAVTSGKFHENERVHIFALAYLGSNHATLAGNTEEPAQVEMHHRNSMEYREKALGAIRESDRDYRPFKAWVAYGLGISYAQLGKYEKSIAQFRKIPEEFQNIGHGPYDNWFAKLHTGSNLGIALQASDGDHLAPIVQREVEFLHELAERYENEVGYSALAELHAYYVRHAEDRGKAEQLFERTQNLVDRLGNEHIAEDWQSQIDNMNDFMLAQRGWDYAEQ